MKTNRCCGTCRFGSLPALPEPWRLEFLKPADRAKLFVSCDAPIPDSANHCESEFMEESEGVNCPCYEAKP